jgi:hypothetical protein
MSPLSNAIESLAARYGVPVLEAQEHWAERAAIREYDGGMSREAAEAAALADTELWAKLWIALKGDGGPQLGLGIGAAK